MVFVQSELPNVTAPEGAWFSTHFQTQTSPPIQARQPGVKTLIRNAKSADLPGLREVAEGTQMFLGEELDSFLTEMAAHLSRLEQGEQPSSSLVVATDEERTNAQVLGTAFFAPEAMAQGVMNLLFIGVRPDSRTRGVGRALLDQYEKEVVSSGARLSIIETASDEMFTPAWSLYEKAGYTQEARVRDFYDDGLDKLIFRKHL